MDRGFLKIGLHGGVAGKYLGVLGVNGMYALTLLLIAVLGLILSHRHQEVGPGQVQEIPAYTLPDRRAMLRETWARSSDVLTIVTPLLVFITFYVPCISTFAIMHKALGRAQAWFFVALPAAVALALSVLERLVMGMFV